MGKAHFSHESDPYGFLASDILAQTVRDWRKYGDYTSKDINRVSIPLNELLKVMASNGYYDVKIEVNAFLNSNWCVVLCDMAGMHPDAFRRATPDLPWII